MNEDFDFKYGAYFSRMEELVGSSTNTGSVRTYN